jgi:macrodomain Ter protein organizer (MatP/YcbG family)
MYTVFSMRCLFLMWREIKHGPQYLSGAAKMKLKQKMRARRRCYLPPKIEEEREQSIEIFWFMSSL